MYLVDSNAWLELLLEQERADAIYEEFLSDTIEDSGVGRIQLDTNDLKQVLTIRQRFRLDFDDAYQYVAAEKHDPTLVSFDSDFDRTERGRKTPEALLSG